MPPAFTAKAKPPSTVLAKLTLPRPQDYVDREAHRRVIALVASGGDKAPFRSIVLPVTFRLVKAVVLPTAPSKAAMPPAFTAKAKPPSTVLAKLTLPPAARLLLIERLTGEL